jgi:MFS family permease
MTPITAPERPIRPIGLGFAAAYLLAQVGAYTSFVPLLLVLTPLKAAAIDPAHKTQLLAVIFFWGAITASVANLVAGAISDRTRSRFGRRRPWLILGILGALVAYGLIWAARTPLGLALGLCFFQLAFNFMFSALNAIVPDQVPDQQKGKVSVVAVLGFPIGTVVGTTIVGKLVHDEALRFIALGAAVSLSFVPLVLTMRDPVLAPEAAPPRRWAALVRSLWIDPRTHRDFAFAWAGRFLVILSHNVVQTYALFYLQDAVRYARLFPGHSAEEGLSVLSAVSCATSISAGVLCGALSDRFGRRRMFVTMGAALLACAMVSLAVAPGWGSVIAAYLVYGFGVGCFYTVDMALIAQVLPRVRDAGKDLGIINLSNTLPQAAAPMVAVLFLGAGHNDYRTLFLATASAAVLGGLLVLPIRSVK